MPPDLGQGPHIGTSGWHYDHWRGPVYAPAVPKTRWLSVYAERFDCVEVNSSFYRFPSDKTVRAWVEAVPPGFRFALKASRYITHQRKLKKCAEPLRRFLDQAAAFGDRLGPVLFQLPPRWRVNLDRLEEFLILLPEGLSCAMELRDPSWHVPSVYDLLAARSIAFCQFEIAGLNTPEVVTANLVYVRLHGPGADAYRGSYSDGALAFWAGRIRRWLGQGRDVWLFFDNDEAGYAVRDALRLNTLLHDAASLGPEEGRGGGCGSDFPS
ncbi:MAG: DUF72 domain-containing protein [Pseudomonadota bacterium]|nr:DUF72 domain-containing protein [Pseudomonadota bacterium]